jgi:uncharacterized protein
MKPLSVEQCVREGLHALSANKMEVIPGRLNRVLNRIIPAWVMRRMNGDRLKSGNGLYGPSPER